MQRSVRGYWGWRRVVSTGDHLLFTDSIDGVRGAVTIPYTNLRISESEYSANLFDFREELHAHKWPLHIAVDEEECKDRLIS